MFKKPIFGKPDDVSSTPEPRLPAHGVAAAPPRNTKAEPGQPAGTAPAPATVAESPVVPRSPERQQASRLLVGPEVKLKGAEIADCDTLVVEGRVEATMDSRVIQISESGSFSGKVGIDMAEIRGRFEGELTARKQLVIYATGRVSGKIRYGKIVIEEGGELSGDVKALSAESAAGASSPGDAPSPDRISFASVAGKAA